MASIRPIILTTGEIYHVFNRGVERRDIFTSKTEYKRVLDVINYYQYANTSLKFSQYIKLNTDRRNDILLSFNTGNQKEVTIIAFCLMPNHFHLLLKQDKEAGISRFVANFCNSYSKYFNTKHERVGPLFQGPFKAKRIETDEQLIHLSRYIHLNPITSYLIREKNLDSYMWSSLPEYLGKAIGNISDPSLVMANFKNINSYRQFVHDQINYAKGLEKIKQITLEE